MSILSDIGRGILVITLTSCLPVDDPRPDCFPEEPCPRGLLCVEGRCEQLPERHVIVSFSCLTSPACLSTLDERSSLSSEERPALCLILEQPQRLSAYRLSLEPSAPQELTALLSASALRASLALINAPECPSNEPALRAMGLDLTCSAELGCVLRLRHPQLSAEQMEGSSTLTLNFSGEVGQCLERTWGAAAPQERCDGLDDDCDGFIDEEVSCP